MHCVLWIQTKGKEVKTRRNLAHWGSWDTVYACSFDTSIEIDLSHLIGKESIGVEIQFSLVSGHVLNIILTVHPLKPVAQDIW